MLHEVVGNLYPRERRLIGLHQITSVMRIELLNEGKTGMSTRWNGIIAGLILVLVVFATATGIFYRTKEPQIEHVTVRGDRATFQGSGLYRYDPDFLAREAIIWDVINLLIAVPLFAVGIFLSGRNSLRGRLLLAGLLMYLFYVYLMYATMMAFNPLFLVYVAIFSLSIVALAINLSKIDIGGLPQKFSERFPVRIFTGYMVLLAVMMIGLWVGRIIPMTLSNSLPPELTGLSTLESQALDLGLIAPIALSAAVLLWRNSPWGYLLTGIGITHGFMMFISIPAWIVVPLIMDGSVDAIEAIPFLILSFVGILLAVWFFRGIQLDPEASVAK